MAAKVTRVTLFAPALNLTEEFEITHAERLLRMQGGGGWKLKDTNFEFTSDGTIIKRHTKGTARAKGAAND